MEPFLFREAQKFECRDCPSRCCRMPWRIAVTDAEKARYEVDAWAVERVKTSGSGYARLASGRWAIPMVEFEGSPCCAFLETDGLCGLQKRHGHEFIPRVCQVFPFDFVEDEEGRVRVGLSHLCPSIRDNYGRALGPQLEAKFAQDGGKARAMVDHMVAGERTLVGREIYIRVAGFWRERLESGAPLARTLADLHDGTIQFGVALEGDPSGRNVDKALDAAREAADFGEDLALRQKDDALARLLFAALLLPLSYPVRVAGVRRGNGLRRNLAMARAKVSLAMGKGEWDLLFFGRVKARELAGVSRVLGTEPFDSTLREFLLEVLDRRAFFVGAGSLGKVTFLMGAATAFAARLARVAALARGSAVAEPRDFKDAISAAEFRLLAHGPFLSGTNPLVAWCDRICAGFPLGMRRLLEVELADA